MLARGRLIQIVSVWVAGIASTLLFSSPVRAISETASPSISIPKQKIVEASRSPRWLSLYQYEQHFLGGYRSDVVSERFFFSAQGRTDPETEMRSAIEAYSRTTTEPTATSDDGAKRYGTQRLAAACVFPARKKVLEDLLDQKFPAPPCPELKDWLENINANQINLVFVGAYAGNPASILGHSFMRLTNSERENSGREGLDLLSYSIGYMAHADPRDNRMMYMLKGLTGGYPGFYEIEKHYMKVGLYNNSESRDLWDLKLNFSPDEVELLALHLWELTFNAQINYYFIDENCSYRLIKMLEAIRPDSKISSRLSAVVLPAETIRATFEEGWIAPETQLKFRASIQRRLQMKLALLSSEEQRSFHEAKNSVEKTMQLSDTTILDALLDHWLYENFKAHAQLPEKQKAIMEATYTRASQLKTPSRLQLTNEEIRQNQKLVPPFSGHKPQWLEARLGTSADRTVFGLSYRAGVHPLWSGDVAYRDIAAIEYLGLDLESQPSKTEDETLLWSALLLRARSIENILSFNHRFSWSFEAKATNHCLLCRTDHPQAETSGGIGIGAQIKASQLFLLAHAESHAWAENGAQGLLAPGFLLGAKFTFNPIALLIENSSHWWKELQHNKFNSRLSYAWRKDENISLQFRFEELRAARSESALLAGYTHFFN